MRPKDREIVERIRQAVRGQPVEETLRKFSRDNKDNISDDDLFLGLSKLNANLFTGDVKEFINIMKGV